MSKREVDYDPRAQDLSEEALDCRASGGRHPLESLRAALKGARIGRSAGSVTVERHCQNGCGYFVTEEFSTRLRERVSRTSSYPKRVEGEPGYLLPPNSGGRMLAADAVAALMSRVLK